MHRAAYLFVAAFLLPPLKAQYPTMKASTTVTATLLLLLQHSTHAFTTTAIGSHHKQRTTTAIKDVAAFDPEMIKGALQNGDKTVIAAAGGVVAVAVAAAAAATTMMGKDTGAADTPTKAAPAKEEPEPEPIDVSIPYNAAARLAFAKAKLPESKFEEFEKLYVKKAVADVTAKKMAREVANMEKSAEKLSKDMESLS
eukprot:scaffold2557_cov121-Cylindrotheca_fusiformis.AAC.11